MKEATCDPAKGTQHWLVAHAERMQLQRSLLDDPMMELRCLFIGAMRGLATRKGALRATAPDYQELIGAEQAAEQVIARRRAEEASNTALNQEPRTRN